MIRGDAPQKVFHFALFLGLLGALCAPAPVHAIADIEVPLPSLEQFVDGMENGEPDDLRGLYVTGVLADAIVGQPEDMPAFVSSEEGVLTQFGLAENYDTYGLLAHNYLAGEDFFELDKGQRIHLVFGDGNTETYVVEDFLRYQALSPSSVTSDFVDLETGKHFTTSQLFQKIFNRPGQVVLQTCIHAESDSSWGRMFVIAVPLAEFDFLSLLPEIPSAQ